jgi:predicted RNA binding protein YcfA (HicA-like mRNA interferase family)
MTARQVMALVRSMCRRHDVTLDELRDRGKGSHRVYAVRDGTGQEVARVTITDHPGDLSWAVLRDIENKLAHLFGPKWTEKR